MESPQSRELTRDEIADLMIDGLKFRGEWPNGRQAHIHFDAKVKNLESGELDDVVITAIVSPLYGEDELLST